MRSGEYRKLNVLEVREGELKGYNPFKEEYSFEPIADPMTRVNAKVVGYYAAFELTNGFRKELYWTKEQMEAHAKAYSKGYRSDLAKKTAYTFWSKDFNEMAKKTMIRQLISKWGIMSVEFQKAYQSDMAVIGDNGEIDYTDNGDYTIEDVAADVTVKGNTQEAPEVNFSDADEPDFLKQG